MRFLKDNGCRFFVVWSGRGAYKIGASRRCARAVQDLTGPKA